MTIFKRLLTVLLCAIICFSFATIASAATNAKITVTSVEATPGESVKIDVKISDNPGIMAMAFCITYDTSALVYKNFESGILSDYKVYDHPDKGHVSFVNVEGSDKNNNGTIISLLFDVKADAGPGKHIISLANSNREKHGTKLHNSFSNSKQEFILPKVTSGGVTVPETCENSGHKYGNYWTIVKKASCTETGLKKHTCVRCEFVEEVEIPFTHNFETEWTIDKSATPEEDGIMSRHCSDCDAVTDAITFKYEEIGGNDPEPDDSSSDKNESSNSSNNSSDTSSSNNSNNTSSNNSTTSNNSSTGNGSNEKPAINNVVGEKVPLQLVEKLEDFQTIKPSLNYSDFYNEDTSSETTQNENSSSLEITPDNSDITTDVPQNNNQTTGNVKASFFATPAGIITAIICSVLSIGTIALGVFLIIKNKKQ